MYRPKYRCACPFYENEYTKGICCSGIADAKLTVLEFDSEEKKYEYIKKHCVSCCPNNCDLFKLLAMKMEED